MQYVIHVTVGKFYPPDPGFRIYGPCDSEAEAIAAAKAHGFYNYRVMPLWKMTPNDQAQDLLSKIHNPDVPVALGVGIAPNAQVDLFPATYELTDDDCPPVNDLALKEERMEVYPGRDQWMHRYVTAWQPV